MVNKYKKQPKKLKFNGCGPHYLRDEKPLKTTTLLTYEVHNLITDRNCNPMTTKFAPGSDDGLEELFDDISLAAWGDGTDWFMVNNVVYRVLPIMQGSDVVWTMYIPLFQVHGFDDFTTIREYSVDADHIDIENTECKRMWRYAFHDYEIGLIPRRAPLSRYGGCFQYWWSDRQNSLDTMEAPYYEMFKRMCKPTGMWDTYISDFQWRLNKRVCIQEQPEEFLAEYEHE